MALKRLKTKQSKRVSARQRYKIQKKVRDHNKKARRVEKKNIKNGSKKQKLVQIPNICPFKEDILKEVEAAKRRQEEERQKSRDQYTLQRSNNKFSTLDQIVENAELRNNVHSLSHDIVSNTEEPYKKKFTKDQSLKQYFKEFKRVLENADVVLEVVDARDPLGTRCLEVERVVRSAPGNKRLVLVLNKADLVPRDNLNNWLRYFRRFGPVTAFKASTQNQKLHLGRRNFQKTNTDKALQGSTCVGADLLMSMLANYCRNNGVKSSIRVGIIGIPNVGKSSIINSLTRNKVCSVGCTPGVTKVMQEVELDSKIRLIDCPGIVFSSTNNEETVLKNAQRVGDVKDPFTIAESVLRRASKDFFCKLYDVSEYNTFEEFFSKKAVRMGKFLRKGVPDVVAAARSVLNDWNSGKIKYCTNPPEVIEGDDIHVSAAIVNSDAREFDVENFEKMETEMLAQINDIKGQEIMQITSCGPVEHINPKVSTNDMNDNSLRQSAIIDESDICAVNVRKRKSNKANNNMCTLDPSMDLEGNQCLNKKLKNDLKKNKKQNVRNEKKVANISNVLDRFRLDPITSQGSDKYDFDQDFIIE